MPSLSFGIVVGGVIPEDYTDPKANNQVLRNAQVAIKNLRLSLTQTPLLHYKVRLCTTPWKPRHGNQQARQQQQLELE